MDIAAAPVGGSELLSFAGSLIVVVASIVAFGWLYSRSKNFGGGRNDAISVVANKALGSRERLLLVEVADKQMLVGMTSSNIQTLHVFDAPVVKAPVKTPTRDFASRMKTALREIRR